MDEGDEMIIDVVVLNVVDIDEFLDELVFFVVMLLSYGMIMDIWRGVVVLVFRFFLM